MLGIKKELQAQKGLGLVEIMVAVAVILVAFTAVLQLFQLQTRVEAARREEVAAYALLAEAMEAVRSVRDDGWTNISSLSTATNYYPEISGGAWVLSTTDPGPVDGYTRWAVFSTVRRDDVTHDITSSGGSIDTDTFEVVGYIEWQRRGATQQRTVTTYITNWQSKL